MKISLPPQSQWFSFVLKATFLVLIITLFSVNTSAQNCSVNAGIPQTICANDRLFLYGGLSGSDDPQNPAFWSQVAGPSVIIVDPYDLNTEVTNFQGGITYTFRLQNTCEDGSLVFQDVDVTVLPITFSDAGTDATYCASDIANLSANSPGTNETALWHGSGAAGITIDDLTAPNSSLTISSAYSGVGTFLWTITNSNGCTSTDTVAISNRGGVTPVDAGGDQSLSNCYSSTQKTNLDATYGGTGIDGQVGTWEVITGPNIPSIDDIHDNQTLVTGLIEGTYYFRWSVFGPCDSGTDTMMIVVPPPTADVSGSEITLGDQEFCDGRTSTVLEGTAPQYVHETVEWTQLSGPTATIVSPNSPVTEVKDLDGVSTYGFLYTIIVII